MSEHYDVIIIGTGAGGGTLAHRLAPTGKRILLLERGGYLPREPENWDSQEVFLNERYSGDIVVVSCGAVNSAALLLRSANDAHPRGLANASGVVGRHYMAHINSGVIAISQTPNETKFQKTLGVNDYYWGADDFEYPLGHIQMLGKSDRHSCAAARRGSPRAWRWTTWPSTRSTSG